MSFPSSSARSALVFSCLCLALAASACSQRPGVRADGGDGTGGGDSGNGSRPDGTVTRPDANRPPVDPFDPAAGCGSTAVPTERVPGSVLIVFDRSSSMDDPPGCSGSNCMGTSKWELARNAINQALTSLPDELNVGLLLFPDSGSTCDVTMTPQVPVAPLRQTRASIRSLLMGNPSGSGTPIYQAAINGLNYLATLNTNGARGIILVTDGAQSALCSGTENVTLDIIRTRNQNDGYLTYAVGLEGKDNFLSTAALNGGTRRTPMCAGACTGGSSCNTDADCNGGRCTTIPIINIKQCTGGPSLECCSYDVASGSFQMQFQDALTSIARRFLDTCVFPIPRGSQEVDPTRVNVGVTFEGQPRTVLGKSSDTAIDSWNYTTGDPATADVVIQGPICERLKMTGATVEIVVGCSSIIL